MARLQQRVLWALGASLALTACAMSSGILPMGPDTYTISVHAAPARGGEVGAKGIAIREANAYCTNLGKQLLVIHTNSGPGAMPGGDFGMEFRCLAPGDPELVRPTYSKEPDTVIEDRRK
jgi:hypothetical protein